MWHLLGRSLAGSLGCLLCLQLRLLLLGELLLRRVLLCLRLRLCRGGARCCLGR